MANENPFQNLFVTLGRLPAAHAESVNRQAYEALHDMLAVPVEKPGRCILLRAPRAGHGKTHLLSRIQHHLGTTHEFIPLNAVLGSRIDAASVIDDALRRLLRPLPASNGLTILDLVTRRLFALALQPLVRSGEVPCQDREGALAALRNRPIETFDFHHSNAVTAHWARDNFEVLGPRLSVEFSQRCGLPVREVSFWVDTLFRFASTPIENPLRLRSLADAVRDHDRGNGALMERLEALLGMLTQLMRVVLVADDLEGFSSDEAAALRLAAFLGALRQSVERIDVILAVNRDVWDNAFAPRLSSGLADRLSEVMVELKPLNEGEMVDLLESRVPGMGAKVLAHMDREAAGTHARGLIRAAGAAWVQAVQNSQKNGAAVSGAQPAPQVAAQPEAQAETPALKVEESVKPAAALPSAAGSVVEKEPAGERAEKPAHEVPQTLEVQKKPASEEPPAPSEPPAEPASPPPSKIDRVDELLRQFRERFGRGGV